MTDDQPHGDASVATIVIAGLFLVLAFSNFGLFELQLPAAISTVCHSGERYGGSLCGAATLGFTSAFLIGPCVTAPLAGALLYIARTGDMVVGAGHDTKRGNYCVFQKHLPST